MSGIDVKSATIKDATHYLSCAHAIGKNRKEYRMKCLIIKVMLDWRLKLLVFGDRDWKRRDHKKSIRYVNALRLKPIKPENKLPDIEIHGMTTKIPDRF